MPGAQLINRLSPRETVRPRCPVCRANMKVLRVVPERPSFEHWTLKCRKCGLVLEAQTPADPINSEALGWFDGELKPPR